MFINVQVRADFFVMNSRISIPKLKKERAALPCPFFILSKFYRSIAQSVTHNLGNFVNTFK